PEGLAAPEPMRAAIMKAMSKTPDERFESVKTFYESFSQGGKMAGGTAVISAPAHVTITTSSDPVSMRGATMATPAVPIPAHVDARPPMQAQMPHAMPPAGPPPVMAAPAA